VITDIIQLREALDKLDEVRESICLFDVEDTQRIHNEIEVVIQTVSGQLHTREQNVMAERAGAA